MTSETFGLTRRTLGAGIGVALVGLVGCGKKSAPSAAGPPLAPTPPGTLEWALAGAWRSASDRQRDKALHPLQTLEFFGVKPGATVAEVWPGTGWWTQIIGPYLSTNKGKLYAATFEVPNPDDPAAVPVVQTYRKMILDRPDLYGGVVLTSFGPHSAEIAPAGVADVVLFFDLDSWMTAGLADKAFHDAFTALKPGGVLGVVQARGEPGGLQDPLATNGYVQEAFVKQMAAEAGFSFDKDSPINANPDDRKDSKKPLPFAPPVEPDRMTLRFRKK